MRGWSGRRSTYVYFGVTPQKSNNSIRTTNKKVINLPYIVICLFHKIQWMRNIYSNCMNYYQSTRPHSEKSLAHHHIQIHLHNQITLIYTNCSFISHFCVPSVNMYYFWVGKWKWPFQLLMHLCFRFGDKPLLGTARDCLGLDPWTFFQ